MPPMETKPTNPKDIVGSSKLPLDLAPDTIKAEVALAHLEGALKYGRYNWRIAGVRASIYKAAAERHLMKWWNGEDYDQTTRVKHLASVIACAGILLDAELCGKLTDDRPPRAPIGALIEQAEKTVKHLKDLFKDHDPRHYTIDDSIPLPDLRGELAIGEEIRAAGGRNGPGEIGTSDNSLRSHTGVENTGAVSGGSSSELDPRVREVLDAKAEYWSGGVRGGNDQFYKWVELFIRLTPEQKDKFRAIERELGRTDS